MNEPHEIVAYFTEFRQGLERVGANSLHSDPLIAAAEFASLYTPEEIISGAMAAKSVGLSVTQGVAAFVLISAAVYAERERSSSFLGRFISKRPPKPGTPGHRHVSMSNYVLDKLLEGVEPDPDFWSKFADKYAETLKRNFEG